MDHIHAPSPHAKRGLQASSSTPALPTHLARMSEPADVHATYARGSHTATRQHLVSSSWVLAGIVTV